MSDYCLNFLHKYQYLDSIFLKFLKYQIVEYLPILYISRPCLIEKCAVIDIWENSDKLELVFLKEGVWVRDMCAAKCSACILRYLPYIVACRLRAWAASTKHRLPRQEPISARAKTPIGSILMSVKEFVRVGTR